MCRTRMPSYGTVVLRTTHSLHGLGIWTSPNTDAGTAIEMLRRPDGTRSTSAFMRSTETRAKALGNHHQAHDRLMASVRISARMVALIIFISSPLGIHRCTTTRKQSAKPSVALGLR